LTTILDYGMGNLRSVEKAIEKLGFPVCISSELPSSGKLIIPGVGAFGAAMENLRVSRDGIKDLARNGMSIFGICLGQQLLFDHSEEHGSHDGLGLIRGEVKYFSKNLGMKVPSIGWSQLEPKNGKSLMKGIKPADQVYFVHSLYTICEDESDVAAVSNYGIEFASAVQRDNVWGCQFHPEKSSSVGLRILENFLSC